MEKFENVPCVDKERFGGSHKMNSACSRYHMVYKIRRVKKGGEEKVIELYDLRAPERAVDKSGVKEVKAINQSIGALWNVITALSKK